MKSKFYKIVAEALNIEKPRVIVDDSTFVQKDDPTQYSKENNIIYVKSTYDIKNDPAGWMVHEYKHAELKDLPDEEQYPDNTVERAAYKAQFKYLKIRDINHLMKYLKFLQWNIKNNIMIF